ncbi:hypothetical protein C2E20_2444 [Micractinium conductrix]|uniref:Uncharacterized protein n=1 Tax=Micractinium conductrix TaxID=554055 RepID=A0A2P6VK37_9CHLO|nr:hypothetical protein C2E20_2444 [Micractinium conductrix]|eukprot:PSC74462.1 hypothetical protein C2E20_2444 [Micractinium conductrix]
MWHDALGEQVLSLQHQHSAVRRASSLPAHAPAQPLPAPSPPPAVQGCLEQQLLRQRQQLGQQREAQQRWAAEAQRLLQRGTQRSSSPQERSMHLGTAAKASPPTEGTAAATAALHRLQAEQQQWRAAQAWRRQHHRDARLLQHEAAAAATPLERQLEQAVQLAARKMAQHQAQQQQLRASAAQPSAQRQRSAPLAAPPPSQPLTAASCRGGAATEPQPRAGNPSHHSPHRSPEQLQQQQQAQPMRGPPRSGASLGEHTPRGLAEVVSDLAALCSSAADRLPAGFGQPSPASDGFSESTRVALPLAGRTCDTGSGTPAPTRLLGVDAVDAAAAPQLRQHQRQRFPAPPLPHSPVASLLPSPGASLLPSPGSSFEAPQLEALLPVEVPTLPGPCRSPAAALPATALPATALPDLEAALPEEACCLPRLDALCLPAAACLPDAAAGDDDFLRWLLD